MLESSSERVRSCLHLVEALSCFLHTQQCWWISDLFLILSSISIWFLFNLFSTLTSRSRIFWSISALRGMIVCNNISLPVSSVALCLVECDYFWWQTEKQKQTQLFTRRKGLEERRINKQKWRSKCRLEARGKVFFEEIFLFLPDSRRKHIQVASLYATKRSPFAQRNQSLFRFYESLPLVRFSVHIAEIPFSLLYVQNKISRNHLDKPSNSRRNKKASRAMEKSRKTFYITKNAK